MQSGLSGRKVYGGPDAIHATEGQLRRGYADHLRAGSAGFPSTIAGMAFAQVTRRPEVVAMLNAGLAALHALWCDDLLLSATSGWRTQFQPQQIADDLKKYGGYIPGVRPGRPTADFLDFTMTRLTLPAQFS
jgi:preprotein translocase subunit SecY